MLLTLALLAVQLPVALSQPHTKAQSYIDNILLKEPLKGATLGVLAMTVKGDTLACLFPGHKLVPASNLKLVTTGAALNTLGPDYRFQTSLCYRGEVRDSVLYGDLYIVGGADPTLGGKDKVSTPVEETFAEWMSMMNSEGIYRVEGSVVGDSRWFDGPADHQDWPIEDLGFYYGVGSTGLNFYENARDIAVAPSDTIGKPVKVVVTYPLSPWLEIQNAAVTLSPGGGDALVYVESDMMPIASMRGGFAADRVPKTEHCSNRFSAYTCANYFYNYLNSKGMMVPSESYGEYADISYDGKLRFDLRSASEVNAADSDSLILIGKTFSAPLRDIVYKTNHESDNFYAETLLRTIGRQLVGSSGYSESVSAERKVLSELAKGIDLTIGANIRDGSGLSRKNYISPDWFVRFLRAMTRTEVFPDYLLSLPQPGAAGTLQSRMSSTPKAVKNRIYVKTGSMSSVSCLNGYILPEGYSASQLVSEELPPETVIFSIMVNGATTSTSTMNGQIDHLVELLAQ